MIFVFLIHLVRMYLYFVSRYISMYFCPSHRGWHYLDKASLSIQAWCGVYLVVSCQHRGPCVSEDMLSLRDRHIRMMLLFSQVRDPLCKQLYSGGARAVIQWVEWGDI